MAEKDGDHDEERRWTDDNEIAGIPQAARRIEGGGPWPALM